MALAEAAQIDGRLFQILRPLGRDNDRRGGAVGDRAAVEQVERLGDVAGGLAVLGRDRAAVDGVPGPGAPVRARGGWRVAGTAGMTMPSSWVMRALNSIWKLEVGALVSTASISFFSMPQSSIALRIASMVRLSAERPGSLP